MSKRILSITIIVGLTMLMVTGVIAGKGDYSWERWALPEKIDCIINYDGNGDGTLEEYYSVSTEGYFTFKAGNPYDYVLSDECDWLLVFESANGDRIRLTDASWNELKNDGWKENYYIYPENHCLKYLYEATGTWCGYDEKKDVYFWGTWSTLPQGKPYFVSYVIGNGDPTLTGQWRVVGCSASAQAFEVSEGSFEGTRLEYGLD